MIEGSLWKILDRRHVDQAILGITHNALEILWVKAGLFSFFKDNKDIKHIRVMMNNNTAVAYINNMRWIRSNLCDDIAFNI